MLSKVAEKLYWTARYMERVESTARLVSVYDSLLFDLPQEFDISWYNLVTLNSSESLFEKEYANRSELNVVKFLLADEANPSSMLSALNMVRENVRTTRDVLPYDYWEMVNELHIFARGNIRQGIFRRARHKFLGQMIKGCQQINGSIMGTMSRDASWHFLRLGRNLERADMATRLLDAGAVIQILSEAEIHMLIGQVVWGNVLRSSSADLSYRRTMRSAVRDCDVAAFLLYDPHFPRSLHFCLSAILAAVKKLPNSNEVVEKLQRILKTRYELENSQRLGDEFRDYLNQLQLDLGGLHLQFSQTWFSLEQKDTA